MEKKAEKDDGCRGKRKSVLQVKVRGEVWKREEMKQDGGEGGLSQVMYC